MSETKVSNKLDFPLNEFVSCHEDEYFSAPGMNGSALVDMLVSPKHFYYRNILGHGHEETPSKKFGKLTHLAILETERFLLNHVVEPEFWGKTQKGEMSQQSKEAKEKRKAWHESLGSDAIVLKPEEVEKLMGMINSINQDEVIKNLIHSGKFEQSLWVKDEDSGEYMKGRLDLVNSSHWILDLKTASDASPEGFAKAVARYNYHVKAAWYSNLYFKAFEVVPKYAWLAIEPEPPYATGLYVADMPTLDQGEKVAMQAFKRYLECKKKNVWPSYTTGAQMISLPTWAMTYFED